MNAATQYDWWVAPGSTAALEAPTNYRLNSSGDIAVPTAPPDSTTAIAFTNANITNTTMLANGDNTLDSLLVQAGANSIDLQNHTLSFSSLSLTGTTSTPAQLVLTDGSLSSGSVVVNPFSTLTLSNSATTVAQSTTITGTFTLAGNYTTNSLDASNATAFSFATGNLTINAGVFNPWQSATAGFTNSAAISSSSGASATTLTIQNGANATIIGTGNSWLFGISGGAGALAITGSNSTLKTSLTGSANIYIGYGGISTGNTFTPSIGNITITSGGTAQSSATFGIGESGGNGSGSVSGTGSKLQVGGSLDVGFGRGNITNGSTGTLAISSGGQAIVGAAYIGGDGAIGSLSVDGAKSHLTGAGNITVGASSKFRPASGYPGSGTLTITNGASAKSYGVAIGVSGGNGNVSVSGANSTLQATGDSLDIGSIYDTYSNGTGNVTAFPSGALNISNGGNATAFSEINIGLDGGVGTVTVDGPGSTLQSGNTLFVGWIINSTLPYVGKGTLNITNGGVATARGIVLGQTGGYANVSVSGANSTFRCSNGTLGVGYGSDGSVLGTAILSISNGGSVSSSADTNIGYSDSIGSITLANASLTSGGNLSLGAGFAMSSDSAILSINSGGLVTIGNITTTYTGNGTVAINLNGGTLQTGSLVLGNISHLHWTSGTLTITASSGFTSSTLGIKDTLTTGQTLRVSATLTIPFGDSITLTGGTVVTGQLALYGSSGNYFSTFNFNSAGVLIVEAATNKSTAIATLRDEITFGTHSGGITSTALPAHTALAVIDNAALSTPFTTFAGQPVDANSILVAPELLGDANADGHVDLTDLNIVLNNLGTVTSAWTSGNFDGASKIDLTDLNDVLNNLGAVAPGAAFVSFADTSQAALPAPEPTSLAIAAIALLPLLRRRAE